jgi:hypothetical protein
MTKTKWTIALEKIAVKDQKDEPSEVEDGHRGGDERPAERKQKQTESG